MSKKKEVSKEKEVVLTGGYGSSHRSGCDPEFFFRNTRTRRVIGSELVLNKKTWLRKDIQEYERGHRKQVVIDGVQAELNPQPANCREFLADRISMLMREISEELRVNHPNVTVDMSRLVQISPTELAKLNKKNQQFGCSPSRNAYGESIEISEIDALKYRKRAAGGHMHFGVTEFGHASLHTAITTNPDRVVQFLDYIVGNTCVLLDRDPHNKERRKLYGRAGEYRLPEHGLEYRVPSNFWMVSYPLMSFVFGIARIALGMAEHEQSDEYFKRLTKAVPIKDIRKAINKNDYDLALKNFNAIKELILTYNLGGSRNVLTQETMAPFLFFADSVNKKGLKHWFKKDPLTYWANLRREVSDDSRGAYNFLTQVVSAAMRKEQESK